MEFQMQRLYAAYAERFPTYGDLWAGLAAGKEDHAEWLQELEAEANRGALRFDSSRFDVTAASALLQQATEAADRAETTDMSPEEALSTSLELETALLDGRFFEVEKDDPAPLRTTLETILEGTEAHRRSVEEEFEEEQAETGEEMDFEPGEEEEIELPEE